MTPQASRRPNIILIMAEQQRADAMRCAGSDWMITPNLDKLAGEGVLFSRAFCSAATCVSSRASFYTGLYPHSTGIYAFQNYNGAQNWAHRLAGAGYRCVSIGKMHCGEKGAVHGFHEKIAEQGNKCGPWFKNRDGKREKCLWYKELEAAGLEPPLNLHNEMPDFYERLGAVVWSLPDAWHPDAWLGGKAVDWIEQSDVAQPLFLHIGFLGPHDLFDPPQTYIDMYDDRAIPAPQLAEGEKEGMPKALFLNLEAMNNFSGPYDRGKPGSITAVQTKHATPERIRTMRKHYYANCTLIDEQIGRILKALETKGYLANSIVIFSSDHGESMYDHGLIYKGHMYDTVVNIPLIIRRSNEGKPGRRRSDLVSQLDVVQYLLGEAGVDAADLDGVSLRPVLHEDARHTRTYVFAEEGKSTLRLDPDLIAMIRSEDWKLIHYTGNRTGQLFDLRADPGETRNLWGKPAAREAQAHLTAELLDWLYANLYKHRDLFAEHR
ncbi:MAG: sulfatase-like hydrolase/transferase [Kiritimatiellae bacterium]|nr:sulfatase-like hydrolase/transferase [Kiritimatiellia bacterium]